VPLEQFGQRAAIAGPVSFKLADGIARWSFMTFPISYNRRVVASSGQEKSGRRGFCG
jgi:hypothetical protein